MAIALGLVVMVAAYTYLQEGLKSQMLNKLSAQVGAGQLPNSTRNADIRLRRAAEISNHHIEQSDYELALLSVEELIAEPSDDITLHLYAGLLAERGQLWQKALEHFEIIRMNSEEYYQNALQRLALIHYQRGDVYKAQQMISDFLQTTEEDDQIQWAIQMQTLF